MTGWVLSLFLMCWLAERSVCVGGRGGVGEAVCTGESLSQAREGLPCTGRLPPLPCLPTPDRIPPRSRCNTSMPRWLMLHEERTCVKRGQVIYIHVRLCDHIPVSVPHLGTIWTGFPWLLSPLHVPSLGTISTQAK